MKQEEFRVHWGAVWSRINGPRNIKGLGSPLGRLCRRFTVTVPGPKSYTWAAANSQLASIALHLCEREKKLSTPAGGSGRYSPQWQIGFCFLCGISLDPLFACWHHFRFGAKQAMNVMLAVCSCVSITSSTFHGAHTDFLQQMTSVGWRKVTQI